jgi:RNA polymerase primary sigma factor
MAVGEAVDDQIVVRAVLASDPAAVERFLRAIADIVWTACRRLTGDDGEAREAYAAVCADLSADGFDRLRSYDGRSRLATFVALVSRDLLARRLLHLLQEDAQRGWRAFEAFFQADIGRLIQRRLPGAAHEETRRDAYQEICIALIADDYRRLRAYGGGGSFGGFVLHTVDRLLIDFIRSFSMRRRAPAAIARLPALEQDIFRRVYWQGAATDAAALTKSLAQSMNPPPSVESVVAALARVQRALPSGYGSAVSASPRFVSLADAPELADDSPVAGPSIASPEEIAIECEAESLLSTAVSLLRDIAAALPAAERLYIEIALGGAEPLPAREVARLMRRPVEEVYKLKQRVLKHLKEALEDQEAIKKWRASV